jgi:hypothetical protein
MERLLAYDLSRLGTWRGFQGIRTLASNNKITNPSHHAFSKEARTRTPAPDVHHRTEFVGQQREGGSTSGVETSQEMPSVQSALVICDKQALVVNKAIHPAYERASNHGSYSLRVHRSHQPTGF